MAVREAPTDGPVRGAEVCVEGDLTSADDVDAEMRRVVAALIAAGDRELSWDVRFVGDITAEGATALATFVAELTDNGVRSTVVWHPNFEARRALAGLNAEFIDAVLR